MRYSARPVVKIAKSYGEITSIAWDTTRSEMFVFGSKDATFSCCNLELKPHSVMFTYDAKNSVESSKHHVLVHTNSLFVAFIYVIFCSWVHKNG